MKRVVFASFSILFLLSVLSIAGFIQVVKADSGTVYIRADGSIDPPTAPISTVDNVTYTFTGNISYPTYNGIVVEKDNIIIDGNGYTVQGNNSGYLYDQSVGLNLTDASNVLIENANIVNFHSGIYLSGSNNNTISGNNATANGYLGIWLEGSSNNTVSGNKASTSSYPGIWLNSSSDNTVSGNDATGIELDFSNNNTVSGNNATSLNGIWLASSSNNNTVSGNTATANRNYGISVWSSSNNTISGNNATENGWFGIYLYNSPGNVLFGNVMENNGWNFGVSGDFMNSVDTSNLVNGKPVYYMTSRSNLVISPENYPDIGYLAVVNCTNMTVQGLTLTNEGEGILLAFTNDSHITNNNVTNDLYGICLASSSNNTVSGNTATANYYDGIKLGSSSNNVVSGNNATANSNGISLASSSNNTVSGNTATANSNYGIYLDGSNNNTISGNNATPNWSNSIYLKGSNNNIVNGNIASAADGIGIWLAFSSNNNTISGNTVATTNGWRGIYFFEYCSNNIVYHNNFIGNGNWPPVDSTSVGNVWDDGHPSGGNYWSDYNGTDLFSGQYQNVTGSDGIGDTPYVINANNMDHYPLMGVFSTFSVAGGTDVQVVSNSTVSDFQFNGTALLFNVTGANGTTGFCNICIPTSLLNGTLRVFVNGTQVSYSLLPSSNSSLSYLYFIYSHSTEQVTIIPEFPDSIILAIFMLTTLLAIAIHKKKHSCS